MKLRPFRALWGHCAATDGVLARSPHLELETLLPALKALGYRGVEMCLSHALALGPDKTKRLLDESGLKVGFVIFSDGVSFVCVCVCVSEVFQKCNAWVNFLLTQLHPPPPHNRTH
jgi:hypothetical protein